MNIKLTAAQKIRILNAEDIYTIMRDVLMRENKIDRDKEHLWLVCLSNTNKVLMIELISMGSVHSTIIEPMDVFSFALQKRAVKLILVHNHPGGELHPSSADLEITERMFAIGLFVRVPIIDHLIISPKGFYSFDEHGLMDKMEREKRYDLSFKEQERLLKEMERISIEKDIAEQERKIAELERKDALAKLKEKEETIIEIARKLRQEGYSTSDIVNITGLREEQY